MLLYALVSRRIHTHKLDRLETRTKYWNMKFAMSAGSMSKSLNVLAFLSMT